MMPACWGEEATKNIAPYPLAFVGRGRNPDCAGRRACCRQHLGLVLT